MSYKIDFSKAARKTIEKWAKSNPRMYRKLIPILNEIVQHPSTGLGYPEPLVGGNQVTYFRRIAVHHRIIYDIHDDTVSVLVLGVEGHYGDK